MKVKSSTLSIVILVVIFGGIAITSSLGLYKTQNEKVPNTIKTGEFAGKYDPADIRGSYTFSDIEESFGIPLDDLGVAFGVKTPEEYADFQCKDLETLYSQLAEQGMEVGTGSVRYFVALYRGLPFEVEEGTYLPKTAVDILKKKATLTSEQISFIEQYSLDLPANEPSSPETSNPPEEDSSSEKIIKGNTTFKDLLDWGVTKEDIEKILTTSVSNTNDVIKDFVSAQGIEFGEIKGELQTLVDKIK